MTKVDIISGFLGAGKTTFIKKLLEEVVVKEKTVLIENEYGEIGIDGGFLKDSGIEIKELSSGCICCSLVGDFTKSLKEILTKFSPDRIIIEPSGVGKLSDVLKAVEEVENELEVSNNYAITVVDAKKCKTYLKNFGEFFINQIQYASTIVLSRTDIADENKINEAVELIRSINKEAAIITTPISELSAKRLSEILENHENIETIKEMLLKETVEEHEHHHEYEHHHEHEHHDHEHEHHHDHDHEHHHEHSHEHHHEHPADCTCGCHDHEHHHADEVFESWGMEQVSPIKKEELEKFLDKLSNTEEFGVVLRAKGIVKELDSDKWLHFDFVPEEVQIRYGEADYTGKICVIGTKLNKELLEKKFKGEI